MSARKARQLDVKEKPLNTTATASTPIIAKPLVFISHDSRDAILAESVGNLLMDASGGMLRSFRSSDRKGTAGIEFGAEWYQTIMENLSNATDVVALLTTNSINRPWILYEVGVAKGRLERVAFGVALGVPLEKASSGPFAQFQNCGDDEDSLTKLVVQLIRRNPEANPREEAVRLQVQAFRAKLDGIVKKPAKPEALIEQVDETAVAKLFEEVKVMFRNLPEQVNAKLHDRSRSEHKWRRSLFQHPHVFERLMVGQVAQENPNGFAISWLVAISALRDDFPWLYEIGLEVYHSLRHGREPRIQMAMADFQVAVKMLRFEDILIQNSTSPKTYFFIRELSEMLIRVVDMKIHRQTETASQAKQSLSSDKE